MNDILAKYKNEMEQELENILAYWMKYSIDDENGGFYGRIENDNTVHKDSAKGLVLNSRILWTFSAAYNHKCIEQYLRIADRAYDYIVHHFIDKEFGGAYWTVDYKGKPCDTRKQIYAIAFAVYGLSEYYLASKNELALKTALELYQCIINYSNDSLKGGYIEALTKEWREINDLRLSAKDFNEKKSMNTHLHVLEALANLYKAWPDAGLKTRIEELINIFLDHIIDRDTNHLILFFDEDWRPKSDIISYGHDIEAAWLIQEAAEIIGNKDLLIKVKGRSVKIAEAAESGLDTDGGIWYENDLESKHLIKEKHWWPQAEAMIGFFNAYQISNNTRFLDNSIRSWHFIQQYIIDKNHGEWVWGIKEDHSLMEGEDKAGLWKCPYHNGRACLEIIRRINICTRILCNEPE